MTQSGEKGVALVFTLFLMAALSAMAVSMMFLAQTETSASRNYKTMSQARYAGEAGVHRAVHYLSSTTYTNLVTSTTGFDTSVSPVTYSSNPVVLAPVAANSNHPSTTIKDAFAALFTGASLNVGTTGATVTYSATATLLSMRSLVIYGGGTGVIQTWRINATGTVPGTLPATVEVTAVLERDFTSAETYAIFATGGGCAAIDMAGGAETGSYDSSTMTTTPPTADASGGSVGTNGNLRLNGAQTTVRGNLDTPRTGVGNCSNGNITALDGNPPAVTGDTIRLPQAKVYAAPQPPDPLPGTSSININSTNCLALGLMPPVACSGGPPLNSGHIVITANGGTIKLPNVSMTGGSTLTIKGGLYPDVKLDINSLSLTGGSSFIVEPGTSVAMNVAGTGIGTGTVVDFEGGALSNLSYDPSRLQILYAGAGLIKLTGGAGASATVYAPNAQATMNSNLKFYGSVLANRFSANAKVDILYDRSLASKFFTLGNSVMSSFSWQKY